MPRFKYWVIVMDAVPTAFRAGDAADLLPTLKQLQRRHPEATMKWFERDRYWDSPEAAFAATRGRRRPDAAPRRSFSPKGGPRGGGSRKPRRRD